MTNKTQPDSMFDLAQQLQDYAISKGYNADDFFCAVEFIMCGAISRLSRIERKQFLKHVEDGAKLYKETFTSHDIKAE
jgi:hypothetical protein